MSNVIEMKIDEGAKCLRCGDKGAVNDKLCLKCMAKAHDRFVEPQWTETKDQQYAIALEATEIGADLVRAWHPELFGYSPRIFYVFLRDTPVSKRQEVWGRAKRIAGLPAWLLRDDDDALTGEPFFVIELAYDVWKWLTYLQKIALVDHELSHCSIDDLGKLTMRGHEVEEFIPIVGRHGLWNESVKLMVEQGRAKEAAPLLAPQFDDQDLAAAG